MQESALGSVFIFRGRSIGLDNYKGKESLSRVVQILLHIDVYRVVKEINLVSKESLLIVREMFT